MFENIGWGEIVVLILAGLFILGPERLPGAAQWLGKTVRQVREFASGARDQLKGELGPEYDELRKPLEDLRSLRGMNPRAAITKHLFDGYDPVEDLKQYDVRSDFEVRDTINGSGPAEKPNGYPRSLPPQVQQKPLASGERAPFDPDAT